MRIVLCDSCNDELEWYVDKIRPADEKDWPGVTEIIMVPPCMRCMNDAREEGEANAPYFIN